MDLFIAQITTTFLFFILTGISCLLPLLMKFCIGGSDGNKQTQVQSLLNGLNFIAGGIFIGTILLHLLPDVHDELTIALMKYGYTTSYPVPECIVGAGLLFFLLLEQLILAVQSHGEEFTTKVIKFDDKKDEIDEKKKINYESVEPKTTDDSDDFLQTSSILRSYALLTALSVHSIFEGMVVGFQKDSTRVWELFGALILHKMLVAFSFGSRLLAAKHSMSVCHYIGLLVVFTLMCPVGGLIGTLMTMSPNSPSMNLAQAILLGFATGSFIFITFFEIIRFEGGHKTNLKMCLLVLLGFTAIALEILSHKHDHYEFYGL